MTEKTITTYLCLKNFPANFVPPSSYAGASSALETNYDKDRETATVKVKIGKSNCLPGGPNQRTINTHILSDNDALGLSCQGFMDLVGNPEFSWKRVVLESLGEDTHRNKYLTIEGTHPEAVCWWRKTEIKGTRLPFEKTLYWKTEVETNGIGLIPNRKEDFGPYSGENTRQFSFNLSQTQFVPGEYLQLNWVFQTELQTISVPVAGSFFDTPAVTGGEIIAETLDGFAIRIASHIMNCIPTDWSTYNVGDWAYVTKQVTDEATNCNRLNNYSGSDPYDYFDGQKSGEEALRIIPMTVNNYGLQNKSDSMHTMDFSMLASEDFDEFFEMSLLTGIVQSVHRGAGTIDVMMGEDTYLSGEVYNNMETFYHCEGGVFDEHASAFSVGDEVLILNKYGKCNPDIANLIAVGFTEGVKPCGGSVILISNYTEDSALAFDLETQEILVSVDTKANVIETLKSMGKTARVLATSEVEYLTPNYVNYEWNPGGNLPKIGTHNANFFPHGEYVTTPPVQETVVLQPIGYTKIGWSNEFEDYTHKKVYNETETSYFAPYVVCLNGLGISDNFNVKSCAPYEWDGVSWIPRDVTDYTRVYYHGLFHQDTLAGLQANGSNNQTWYEFIWDSWDGINEEASGEYGIPKINGKDAKPEDWWCCSLPGEHKCYMDNVPEETTVPAPLIEVWEYGQYDDQPHYKGPVPQLSSVFPDVGKAENGVCTMLYEILRMACKTRIENWENQGFGIPVEIDDVEMHWIPILRIWAKMTNLLTPGQKEIKDTFNTQRKLLAQAEFHENISLMDAADVITANMVQMKTVSFVDESGADIFKKAIGDSGYAAGMLKQVNKKARVVTFDDPFDTSVTLLLDPNGGCISGNIGGGARVFGMAGGFDLMVYDEPHLFKLPLLGSGSMGFWEYTGKSLDSAAIASYFMAAYPDVFNDNDLNEIGISYDYCEANGKTYICILLGFRCNMWPGFACRDLTTLRDYITNNFDWSKAENRVNPLTFELV